MSCHFVQARLQAIKDGEEDEDEAEAEDGEDEEEDDE